MLILKTLATGSSGNCYLLSTETETLILDCGIPMKDIKKGLDYNIRKVVGVAVSHSHIDHSKSVENFKNMGVNVVEFHRIENWDDEKMRFYSVRIGSFKVKPFPLPHNNVLNYGFLIEVDGQKILYMTDFEYCKYRFANQKVDHILIECNYQEEFVSQDLPNYKHKILGHCSLQTCKEFVKTNFTDSLKTVLLLHMGQETCNPEECVSEIQKVVKNVSVDYARKGFEIKLRTELCPF